MVYTVAALLIAGLCVAASVRRLGFASEISQLDPVVLLAAVRESPESWRAIEAQIAQEPLADWERDLVGALRSREAALVNEQLNELDYGAQRWARVPRVCASVASSAGFLIAALVMRDALAAEVLDVNAAMGAAINAVVVGLAAAAISVAVHFRARAMVTARLAATDKLVERLERLESSS